MITPSNQVGGALPGVALKAWARVTAAGVLVNGFNITSTSKTAPGSYTVTFTTAMATTTYITRVTAAPVDLTVNTGTETTNRIGGTKTPTVVTLRLIQGGSLNDADFLLEVYE